MYDFGNDWSKNDIHVTTSDGHSHRTKYWESPWSRNDCGCGYGGGDVVDNGYENG